MKNTHLKVRKILILVILIFGLSSLESHFLFFTPQGGAAKSSLLWGVNPVYAQEPFFEGLGSYTRPITTRSPQAQRYFNQGLAFLQAFNHAAAIRSFQEAARLDPTSAMTHWAIALACGPHINFPAVPPPAAELAWKELSLAREYAPQASAVEQALIEALGFRYANPQPDDRSPLDRAYAEAMRLVWQAHPDDPDVGAFFAEALMDLRPWNQWSPEGQPQPVVIRRRRLLESGLAQRRLGRAAGQHGAATGVGQPGIDADDAARERYRRASRIVEPEAVAPVVAEQCRDGEIVRNVIQRHP